MVEIGANHAEIQPNLLGHLIQESISCRARCTKERYGIFLPCLDHSPIIPPFPSPLRAVHPFEIRGLPAAAHELRRLETQVEAQRVAQRDHRVRGGRLRVLELSDNSIDAVPPGVADLRHLRVLRLDGNRLTAVPPALSRLSPHLRRCSLHGNNIIGTLGTLGALANQEMRIGDDDDGASDDGDSNDDSADSDGDDDDDDDAKPP